MMKLTPWIPGETPPVRKGLYQRLFHGGPAWAFWTGKKWMVSYDINDKYGKQNAITAELAGTKFPFKWRGVQECSK